jgi:hypothetical protein
LYKAPEALKEAGDIYVVTKSLKIRLIKYFPTYMTKVQLLDIEEFLFNVFFLLKKKNKNKNFSTCGPLTNLTRNKTDIKSPIQ